MPELIVYNTDRDIANNACLIIVSTDIIVANIVCRDSLVENACKDVFEQIRPAEQIPHNGDAKTAAREIMSVVESVFRMPDAGPAFGSKKWIKWMSNRPKHITFTYAVKFPQLLRKMVLHSIKMGKKKNGFPIKFEGEEVPSDKFYNPTRAMMRNKKKNNKSHKQLSFLNVSSVNTAILFLKNHSLYPVRVDAKQMPNGEVWDNFAEVLYTFWVVYCYHERLVKSSEVSRQVLLYLFYGIFDGPRNRKWPVIRLIHRHV